MYIFIYLLTFFVDGIEMIGMLEIYCRFGRGLEVWLLRYLGEGDLVVFWKWGGFGGCDDGSRGGRIDILGEMGYRVDEYCERG